MTEEAQPKLRFMCKGCEEPCYFHTENYTPLGSPHNCLYGTGCKWHPQIMVDGTWVDTSEEILNSMLELNEENP